MRVVIAESYERIHRSSLVGMGILPLQLAPGESIDSLALTGREALDVEGLEAALAPGGNRTVTVRASSKGAGERHFGALVRIDTQQEALYYQHGGILQYVLRQLPGRAGSAVPISRAVAAGPVRHEGGDDSQVDEGSTESFPASDPPAY